MTAAPANPARDEPAKKGPLFIGEGVKSQKEFLAKVLHYRLRDIRAVVEEAKSQGITFTEVTLDYPRYDFSVKFRVSDLEPLRGEPGDRLRKSGLLDAFRQILQRFGAKVFPGLFQDAPHSGVAETVEHVASCPSKPCLNKSSEYGFAGDQTGFGQHVDMGKHFGGGTIVGGVVGGLSGFNFKQNGADQVHVSTHGVTLTGAGSLTTGNLA